jgi:hypothetical protein
MPRFASLPALETAAESLPDNPRAVIKSTHPRIARGLNLRLPK